MILKGRLNFLTMVMVGVYAPNKQQILFWDELFGELTDDCNSEILMMGDFNAVLDRNMDRSGASSTPGLPVNFHRYKNYFHLVDVWRQANPSTRNYTFFWHVLGLTLGLICYWLQKVCVAYGHFCTMLQFACFGSGVWQSLSLMVGV